MAQPADDLPSELLKPEIGASGPGLPPGGVLALDPTLVRVHVALAARVAERTRLPEAGADTAAITDIADTLAEVLHLCLGLLGARGGLLSLYDPAAERLLVVASEGVSEDYLAGLAQLPAAVGAWGELLATRSLVVVEDTETHPAYPQLQPLTRLGGYRAVCSLPLQTSANEFVGAIDAFYPTPTEPDVQQLAAAAAHARQAGEFVARARLHGQALAIARREQARNAQLRKLAAAALALTGARDLDEVLRVVTETARDIVGTHQAVTSRLPMGWSDATTYVSLSEKYAQWRSYDVAPKGLGVLNYVTREQRPLRLTPEELVRHPDWRGLSDAPGHPPLPDYLAAPLIARDGTNLGLIQLSDKVDGSGFSDEDEAIVVQLAQAASGAIETLELLELERAQGERATRVGSVAAALAEAAAPRDVIEVLTSEVVSILGAAGTLVSLLEGDRLVAAGSRGLTPEIQAQVAVVPLNAPIPLAAAARERRPVFLESWDELSATYPEALQVANRAQRARAILPLVASGRVIGAWAVTFSDEKRFSREEQAGLLALAAVAAQALARAGLYQAEHDMASALQRALLPQQLPELDFATVAGRYLPARQDMEVGGDWYDVIPLPDGDVAVVIGDVQGHSTAAAAVMGQVRNTLRAYALEGHSPATVVGRTNRLLCQLHTSLFATCCYVALHPGTGTAEVVRAGHHQPMLLPGTEPPRFLDVAGGLPLGIDVEELYPTAAVSLHPGDVLALYTDGLVEPPRVADGAARLLAHAATLRTRAADDVAAALLELTEQAEGQPDDVALLVLNYTGRDALRTGRVADLDLPAAPTSPGAARSWLREVLRDWELTPVVDAGELLLSEVITNAVTHGEGPVGVRLREVDSRLRVEVTDGSSRRPVRRETDGEVTSGRGLVLLDALAREWGVEPRGDSKCVWFDLDISG